MSGKLKRTVQKVLPDKYARMTRTYSKDWCQGFCTRCGTSCEDQCEDVYQLQKRANERKQADITELRRRLARALKAQRAAEYSDGYCEILGRWETCYRATCVEERAELRKRRKT